MGKGRKNLLIGFLGLFVIASIVAISYGLSTQSEVNNDAVIGYRSDVCISTTGEFEGRKTPLGENELVQCDHNTLFNSGGTYIQGCLVSGACTALTNITICNATSTTAGLCGAPSAAASEAFTLFNTSSGLGVNATATASYGNSTGAFNVAYTYTSHNDNLITNVTRIGNSSNSGIFAGNTFTAVTLQTNDQLTINWTIWTSVT